MPVRDLLNAASSQGSVSDPYFYDVSLLLNGDGTNGAQNNTFLDSSTNNFTITRNGNTTQGSFSPYGNLWSNYFGSGNYLTAPSNTAFNFGSGAFTWEAWVYVTSALSTNTQVCVFQMGDHNGGGNFLELGLTNNGGTLTANMNLYNSGYKYQPSIGISNYTNGWHHIAGYFTGSTAYVSWDGVPSTGVSYSGSDAPSGLTLRIGLYNDSGGAQYFPGYISNARVVKGTALYGSSTFTPSTTPLTAISGTSLLTCQSNRFIDNSSNAFAITANGSPSVQRFSPFNPTAPYSTSVIGGSGYFDGSGAYLSGSNNITGSGSFTYEAWLYLQSYPPSGQGAGIISSDGTSSGWILRIQPNGTAIFAESGFSNYFTSTAVVPLNAWTHIAAVRNGTTAYLYVNGVQQSSTGTFNNNYSSSTYVIGRTYTNSSAEYFPGYISDARVSQSAVYTTSFTPATAPLSATGASLLAHMTNAGIPDLAMQNDLQTVGSAQVSTSVVKYGTGSLAFNGSSTTYLTFVPNPPVNLATNTWTIEFWLYMPTVPTTHSSVMGESNGGGNTAKWAIFINSNTSYTYQANTLSFNSNIPSVAQDVFVNATVNWSANTWYYIAITSISSAITLWVNGVSSGTGTASVPTGITNGIRIGTDGEGYGSFNGYIDDLRITNGYARYVSNFTPPTAALPTY